MKILLLVLILASNTFAQDSIDPSEMAGQFNAYYEQLIEQERHYNETVYELKAHFAQSQALRKKQLLDEIKKLYTELSFGNRDENKSKLSQIRTLRDDFNKEQKQKREAFKKMVFKKRKSFEDDRLKRKSEFEIKLRKWRAQLQDK